MDDDDDDDDMRVCVCVRDLLFGGQFAIGRFVLYRMRQTLVFWGIPGTYTEYWYQVPGTRYRQMVFVDGIENGKYRFGVGA